MPERYQHKKTATDAKNRKTYYKTIINPSIPVHASDLVIISVTGDRLDTLAVKHYGRSSYWWLIAEANGLGKGSLFIPPGMQLRIPKNLGKIQERQEKMSRGK